MVSAIAPSRSETRNLSRVSVMVSSQHLQLHSSSANLGLPAVYGESILYQVPGIFFVHQEFHIFEEAISKGGFGWIKISATQASASCLPAWDSYAAEPHFHYASGSSDRPESNSTKEKVG